jgi:hemin uptake protein HemP
VRPDRPAGAHGEARPAPAAAATHTLRADAAAAPPLDSEALLRGGKSVEIRHLGAVYRLQATKLGKLILTK